MANHVSRCGFLPSIGLLLLLQAVATAQEIRQFESVDRVEDFFDQTQGAISDLDCSLDDRSCLSEELSLRYRADQSVRASLSTACTQGTNDCFERLLGTMRKIDIANAARAWVIFDTQGWPHGEGWSDQAEVAIWFIFQHAATEETRMHRVGEVLPFVETAFKDGRLTGWHYAAMFDRWELRQGRQQIYGTQFRCKGGRFQNYNLADAESVDDRRAALGMETVAEKAASFGPC